MSTPSDKTQVDSSQTVIQQPGDAPVLETIVYSQSAAPTPAAQLSSIRKVAVGDVLNGRFELVERLGAGGMGAVFKARDLRQVEAGDSDPWLAVKIINENFAAHEKAFTALQQETKKTQRLAHPNIVSVYDFDRDGDIAFMTMELLQGTSLDKVIQSHPNGMEKAKALSVIRQITQAINHAHKSGMVHADLKPANVFLTDSGRVKVLDFGLAQAMQGQDNVFDAHSLKALTPAFASVNMLAGIRPQKADDLYGLGCIFYCLLTGVHPFGKRKATEADAARMGLKKIKSLSSAQWKALESLLAFHPGSDVNIQAFEYGFFQSAQGKGPYGVAAVGVSIVALLGLIAVVVINWIGNQQVNEIAAKISSANSERITEGVAEFASLEDTKKVLVLDVARQQVIDNFLHVNRELQQAEDFALAGQRYGLLVPLYSDSSRLSALNSEFQSKRQRFTEALEREVENRITENNYHRGNPEFSNLVQDLQLLQPKSPVFTMYSLKDIMAKEVGLALYLGQAGRANMIVEQAQQLFPEDRQRFQGIIARFNAKERVAQSGHATFGTTDDGNFEGFKAAATLWQQSEVADAASFAEYMAQLKTVNPSLYAVLQSALYQYLEEGGKGASAVQRYYGAAFPKRKNAVPVRAKDHCQYRFANKGHSSAYRCRDRLTSRINGPELVVVKGNRSVPSFAVTRAEISVNDFNVYCRLYKKCVPRAASPLPITDISYQQAQSYARWVSQLTGQRYHIPQYAQWLLYAKNDSGLQDHNCRVESAGRVIRGNQLRSVNDGYQNSLGLLNVVGNAEEWVVKGGAVVGLGGSTNNNISSCLQTESVDQARAGQAYRGFRLVRELRR